MLPNYRNLLIIVLFVCPVACTVAADMKTNDVPPPQRSLQQPKLYVVSSANDKFGFIDSDGKLKIDLPDDVYTVFPFSDGLAVIAKRVPNTLGRWGFIDETGRVVIAPTFHVARPFSEGLAPIIVREREDSGGKLGYIDTTGRIVIQPQFGIEGDPSTSGFSEGLAAVPQLNGKWGYIDKTGKFVIAPRFSYASAFSEGRAWAGIPKAQWSIDSKMGMIDAKGNWVVEPQFDSAGKFSEGLAAIRVDKKMGYINKQGEIVIKPQFDPFGGCPDSGNKSDRPFSEGLAAVLQNWKWGYIDHSGRYVIKPSYDCAEPFSEGLAVIGVRDEKEGAFRYGYIDKTGTIVIEPRFGFAHSFSGGLAFVSDGTTDEWIWLKGLDAGKSEEQIKKEIEHNQTKKGYIDKTGRFVWRPTAQ
jgi:WG repeat protein